MPSLRCIVALGALFGAVVAVPMKRELVVNTVTEIDVVTEMVTATVWVDATNAPVYRPAVYTEAEHQPYNSAAHMDMTTYVMPTTSSSAYYAPPTPTSTSTTSNAGSSSSTEVVPSVQSPTSQYVAPAPTSTSVYVAPPATTTTTSTSQYVAPTPAYLPLVETTPVYLPPVETTPAYVSPATPSTTSTAAAASPTSGTSDGAQKHTGDLTYYDVGLGSCGYTNSDSEAVVAMAVGLMDKASMCGKSVTITYQGVTKTAQVVDTCMGCADGNLDMSPTLFEAFAPLTSGRVGGAQWSFN